MHEVLVNRLGGLSLPRKSVVRLTDRPDMTLDVYRGRKTTMQQQQQHQSSLPIPLPLSVLADHYTTVMQTVKNSINNRQIERENDLDGRTAPRTAAMDTFR